MLFASASSMFMLVIGLTPLTLMTFGLRFLPGPMLPWILYALLASSRGRGLGRHDRSVVRPAQPGRQTR